LKDLNIKKLTNNKQDKKIILNKTDKDNKEKLKPEKKLEIHHLDHMGEKY
jgi:hypothetical protein